MYKKIDLAELQPTNLTLLLTHRSGKVPKGIIEDVILKVNFMVLDTEPVEI